MGTFVESVAYGPMAPNNQVAWVSANKSVNETLRQLQSNGAEVLDVKLRIDWLKRVGSTIVYLISYRADAPIEVSKPK